MSEEKYVTRRAGVKLVNDELGIPLSMAMVNKDSCLGRGPKVAANYGPKHLYTPEEFKRYALEKLAPEPAE